MIELFPQLLMGHALADFGLQSDWMARNKDRHQEQIYEGPRRRSTDWRKPEVIWPYVLSAHALIHGFMVWLITGSLAVGLFETAAHGVIDFGKCESWYGIHMDQWLHLVCKVLWVWVMYQWYGSADH